MNDEITILYGTMKIKEPEYELYNNEKGQGVLECEFSKLTGDYNELIKIAGYGGIKFKIRKNNK